MTRHITDDQRRTRMAVRHRLIPEERVDPVVEVADSLVALHSTDPSTVYLSIAARSSELRPEDIERALYDDRSGIRHHAMRRTPWVTTPIVGELVHAACTRKIAAVERAKSVGFVGDESWFDDAVAQVVGCVRAAEAPINTRGIGDALPELKRAIVYGSGTVDVSDDLRTMIDAEVRRVRDFIGDTRFKVRFPSPNQKSRLA